MTDGSGLSIVNARAPSLPGPGLLHHLVKPPCDARALHHLSRSNKLQYSYRDLHGAANDIARRITDARLRRAPVGPPAAQFVVPVLIPQSPLLYISLLAILKAGGAFCPLNLDAPPDRISFILGDVSADVVLVSEDLAPRIPSDAPVAIICVDQAADEACGAAAAGPVPWEPSPEDLAYVMYTSGSTGTPKGVGIPHAAVTQALLAHDRHIPPFSRFLQFASPTFDVSVFEIFFPLFRGSTLVSVRREEMLNDLPLALREMNVDACELTPTVAGSLLRSRQNAPQLKLLLTIGEMLNAPVVQEFGGNQSQESILWAMYGPTEATIHCTLQPALPSDSSTANIGVPLDTVSCFIIEPANTPDESSNFKILPVGEAGELAVGGQQLAGGYLNRPEQTASAFISTPHGRVYRTGDRARLTAAGKLECLGRLSSGQVKLRGQRIELGEIEQIVLKTSGCHGAVAAVVDSNLVVFCAVDGDEDVVGDAISSNCNQWLPRFMVPSELVLKREFPRLPSGKVNTKALKDDLVATRMDAKAAEDEQNLSSKGLEALRIVRETLGPHASQRMTLSSAGLDSLAAIRLASSLRKAGFDTSAPELLKPRTISDLCSILRTKESMNEGVPAADVSLFGHLSSILALNPDLQDHRSEIEDVIPCTPLQSAMLAETAQNPTAYCNEVELQAAPGVSAEKLLAAFIEVANANEVLRSGFALWHGKHIAVVFRGFSSRNARVVDEFESDFALEDPHALLSPLRAQVVPSTETTRSRLLLHLHHAVYDGWSMDMILSDISMLLQGALLPPRPQFRHFLQYQLGDHRKWADGAARRFWSEHLLGWTKAPFPRLASSRSLPSLVKTYTEPLQLPVESIQQASRSKAVGVQVFFQAALALVWSGILGENDIVLGSVTSGRTMPIDGIENIMGPCIASLPLRVNLNNMATNAEVLRDVHASNRAIMEHCILPLSDLKRLAGLQSIETLYDVLFVYQESLEVDATGGRSLEQASHLDRLETKLLIEVEPLRGGYNLQATFHPSFIPEELVKNLMGQLTAILEKLVGDEDGSIQTTKSSVGLGLSIFNSEPKPFLGIPDLATGFEATAAMMPTSDALRFCCNEENFAPKITAMSYQELNEDANKMARFLQNSQSTLGQVVAVIMNKSPLLYSSILAIVKAGCAYLPILPSTPVARVLEIFRQASITHCVVDGASLSIFASIEGVQFLNMEAAPLTLFAAGNLNILPDPSRLAYVIFTSGTTGAPKGVAVTQLNIVSNIAHLRSTYPVSGKGQPRFLQACSQAFDVSVFEIFFAWIAGMCLCSAQNDVLFEDLEHSIRQLGITHLSLTPTVASLIDPRRVPRVEFLVTAGEPMTQSVLDHWGERLWQGYGPSETTNICSVKRMARGEHIDHLGWVFPNTSAFVMPPSGLDPVPIGWVGELCFGGDQVAQGYLNDTQLTNEKFVSYADFGRVYRSGDLGRMLADGSLVILGRLDGQIKLRGQRIEVSEVNSVITGTRIAESATTILVRRSKLSPDQLASFYVSGKAQATFESLTIDPEANRLLFATLRSKVPSYMVPSYLIPVSQVPLTSSGKVDKRRLQACFEELSREYLENASLTTQGLSNDDGWTETELMLADMLAASNKVPRADIGRWTPFAALGLDSITTIEFARALTRRFKARVAISRVLLNPSIAQLAESLSRSPNDEAAPVQGRLDAILAQIADEIRRSPRPDPANIEDILLCTPLQEAMLSQGQGSYCNKILLRLSIPAGDMMGYWDEMSRRHGILRTCFVTTKNIEHPIAQVVLRKWTHAWRTFDVHVPSLAGAAQEHAKCLPKPLDSGIPPLSFALIRYKGSTFLSLICHHALYDGVAMGNLWGEVETLANGWSLPPPVPYKPFIQKALVLPEDTDAFWKDHFKDFRPSLLFSRLSGADINQCTHITSFDLPLSEIQGRLKSIGTSLLSACQASWANVLAIACGHPDVAFGNVVSGRTLDLEGLERLAAPCFNTIPVRHDMSQTYQNIEVARNFQKLSTQMILYQFTSLRRIQKILSGKRRTLFDTLLLLQQPLREMDENVWTLEEDAGNMDVSLVCEVVPCPNLNSIVVNMHYDIGIVSGDVVTTLADIFKLALRRLVDLPSTKPLDRVSLTPRLKAGLKDLMPKRDRPSQEGQKRSADERWTSMERKIQSIISELSGVPTTRISRGTSIFHLGLDSINAVQVASMLRRLGFTVSASDVIECPSCEKLAGRISRSEAIKDTASQFELKKFASDVTAEISLKLSTLETIEAILPCIPVQSAMIASFVQTQGRNYLNMMTYKIERTVKINDVTKAWMEIERTHPMLRTGFMSVDHKDSSYAMVRRLPTGLSSRIGLAGPKFDVDEWKTSSKTHIMENLHLPPWAVALVDDDTGVVMHILMHHALYDAQSMEEMLSNVAAIIDGHACIVPQVEPAVAELLSRSLSERKSTQAFWEKQAGSAVVNRFPLMTPLKEASSNLVAHEGTSAMSFSSLCNATQRLGISIQAAIQASWIRVLASYLGESSVIFGVTMSGRTIDTSQNTPLPCITTVPVVASNKRLNRDLVQSMMAYNAELHKHQFAPLGLIQKWLGCPATPAFDTLVVYQRKQRQGTSRQPWALVKDDAVVEYAVSLELEPIEDDKCRLCLTFAEKVLPVEQARLLVLQFDATLEHILQNPDGADEDLYRNCPGIFSVTPAATPDMPTPVAYLHEFVERGALLHPDHTALEFVSGFESGCAIKQTWGYKELSLIGNRVANLLRGKAEPGDIVAIHFDKCPEAYFSILGVLKAGCSFVALDPNAPKSRKEFILSDSQAQCLLVSGKGTVDFNVSCVTLRIDEDSLRACSDTAVELGSGFTPHSTCYCLYTSGTTGTPKGCEITHDNAVQAMMAFQDLFRGHWEHNSRWLQFASLHFDVSILEQYWSWSVGITVVAAPRDLILDDLTVSINKLEITHIDLTPSLARLTHPNELPNLCRGVFITGGESLKQEILDAWGSKAVIYNAYGPTEATIGVTMYQRVPVNGRPSNIGKQFPNVGSYVFRPGTETPVLRGGVGELCVSGKLVGKGYLNRPELTKEKFPTLSEFDERVYRTGDLVRILHNGCFDFLGRADDQIKLRGQRLEIGEINHAIRSCVGISDAATIVFRQESTGKDALVSFLVGDTDRSQSLAVLTGIDGLAVKARAACIERLPSYMVPTYFLRLPYIPLSPNNKAEVKELRSILESLPSGELLKYSAAAATKEDSQLDQRVLDRIIQVVADFVYLPKETLSAATSIFVIGIDSITALRLSARLKSQGFQNASPALVLRNPIVGDLARALSVAEKSGAQMDAVRFARQAIQACHYRYRHLVCQVMGVSPEEIEYVAPCTSLQKGMISRALTDETGGAYFNSFVLDIDDGVSAKRVQNAWLRLVEIHAILRTAFVRTVNGHVQAALKRCSVMWQRYTVQSDDEFSGIFESTRRSWISGNAQNILYPMQLIYVAGPSSRRIIMHIFHALYDGNSFDLMNEHAVAFYNDKELEPAPSFIEALTHGPLTNYESCRQFWVEHLQGWSFVPFKTKKSSMNEMGAMSVSRKIPLDEFERLRTGQTVTLQSVVLALWASTLQRHISGKTTMGVILSGRAIDLQGAERTVGPLFNTVPFFNRSLSGHTWASLIRRAHEFNTAILPFQHVPLQKIQKWCSNGQALFDNLFAFQIEQPGVGANDAAWTIADSPGWADYPLALEATKTRDGQLRLNLVAPAHVADKAELDCLLDELERAAAAAQADELVDFCPDNGIRDSAESPTTARSSADESSLDSSFTWTDVARLVQSEMAVLAEIPAEKVGPSTTVFELGLDSIDVIKLSARLKQRGIGISASHIMRHKTISRLVLELEPSEATAESQPEERDALRKLTAKLQDQVEKKGINMADVETVLPPTALQESMVAGMLQSGFEWYFNHDVFEVAHGVDMDRLGDAWSRVFDQSPILRTGFVEVEDASLDMTYCQIVFRNRPLRIHSVELSDTSQLDQLMKAATTAAIQGGARSELFQLTFASMKERKYVVLSMAHALYDGWSLSLLYQDLQDAYQGHRLSRPSSDAFISRMLASTTPEAREFWANYLEGLVPTTVKGTRGPAGLPRPQLLRKEATSRKLLSDMTTFCKDTALSLQVVCLACWAIVVAERTQCLDVVFGLVLSGRDMGGTDDLLFPTMNTAALRCVLHGSVAGFLKYLEGTLADIRDFQGFPLRKAQAAAKMATVDIFNSLFLFQKAPNKSAHSDELLRSVGGFSAVDYPICVEAEPVGHRLVWRVACQGQLFSEDDAEAILDKLDTVLEFICRSRTADILTFHGAEVSICGLPTVAIKEVASTPHYATAETEGTEEPWNGTSAIIRQVLSQAADAPIEAIEPSTTLYHLGLDSISAIKVSLLLRKRGIQINPRELVRALSIHEMAGFAATAARGTAQEILAVKTTWTPPSSVDVSSLLSQCGFSGPDVETVLPATPMQVYMMTSWIKSGGSIFFPQFCYRIEGSVMKEAQVYRAWDTIMSQAPILRTRLIATGSEALPWLQAIATAEALRSGRAQQPLVRLEVSTEECSGALMIKLNIHHALYDGVSLPAVMARLSKSLQDGTAQEDGDDSGMEQWARFACPPALPEDQSRLRGFWTEYLRDVRESDVPDEPMSRATERTSYFSESCIPDTTHLRALAAQHGLSLQSLFLAAHAKNMAESSGSSSTVTFGVYLANRTAEADAPLTFYPTLSLIPLRVRTGGDGADLVKVAGAIQKDIHAISSHGRANVGLWEIWQWTGVRINSFVNFLSLPQEADGWDAAGAPAMKPHHGDEDTAASAATFASPNLLGESWLKRNSVADAYPASVDVEATVVGKALAIGVFGPRELITGDAAMAMAAKTARLMCEALGTSS